VLLPDVPAPTRHALTLAAAGGDRPGVFRTQPVEERGAAAGGERRPADWGAVVAAVAGRYGDWRWWTREAPLRELLAAHRALTLEEARPTCAPRGWPTSRT
jgi:hypothetical protein